MNYIKSVVGNKQIFVINVKKEKFSIFSELIFKGIQKYLGLNKKILIFGNKKGYYSGVVCKDCGWNPKCSNCDVSVAYHKINNKFFGLCHICKKQYNFPIICPNCGGAELIPYGVGIEQIEEFLLNNFGNINITKIFSENINSLNKIKKIVESIKKSNIILATSILVSGISDKFFKPDLVIFQNADIGINIPDYTARYKNFVFLYEGINNIDAKVYLLQTFNIDSDHIKYVLKNDFGGFKKVELEYRKKYGYPPFGEIAVILYKHEIEEKLFNQVNKVFKEINYLRQKYEFDDIELYTAPPLIYKMFGKYRYNIIVKGKNIRQFLEIVYEKLNLGYKGFKIDWMSQDLV